MKLTNETENENGQVHNNSLRLRALSLPKFFRQGHSYYVMVIFLQPNLLQDHRASLEPVDRRQGIFEWVVRGKRGREKEERVRHGGLHRQECRGGGVRRQHRQWRWMMKNRMWIGKGMEKGKKLISVVKYVPSLFHLYDSWKNC